MRPAGAIFASLLLASALLLTPHPATAQGSLSGTLTASFSTNSEFPGLYQYCLEVEWDVERHDLSHLDIFLNLDNCGCVCDSRIVQFLTPAGQSVGVGGAGPCVNDYTGEYACTGDPSIPEEFQGPAVKFEPGEDACDTGTAGTAVLCFFSPLPPGQPILLPEALAIKHGELVTTGSVLGVMPVCNCAVPERVSTWGSVKSMYR